jgi:uncharacterized protein YidB (DUF937 family)
MGLLDQLLGGTAGGPVQAGSRGSEVPDRVLTALLPVLLGLLADRRGPGAAAVVPPGAVAASPTEETFAGVGGLAGLLARFSRHGQGALASSWVRQGANEALAPEIVGEVFSAHELRALAGRAGIGEEEVRAGLSVLLPAVEHHFTPTGEVPARDRLLASLTDYEKRLPRR